MKISRATYYRYVNELKGAQSQPTSKPTTSISFVRYYNTVMSGDCADKYELAGRLGVARSTLLEYEKEGNLARLAQLLRLKGWTIDSIKTLLGIKSKERVSELLADVVSIDEIRHNLETAKMVFEQCSEADVTLTPACVGLSSMLNKIDAITKSLG